MSNEFIAKKGFISNGNATINGTLSASGNINLGANAESATIYTDTSGNLVLSSTNDIIFVMPSGGNINLGSGDGSGVIYTDDSTGNLVLSAIGNVEILKDISLTSSTIVYSATAVSYMTLSVNGSALAIPLYVY